MVIAIAKDVALAVKLDLVSKSSTHTEYGTEVLVFVGTKGGGTW